MLQLLEYRTAASPIRYNGKDCSQIVGSVGKHRRLEELFQLTVSLKINRTCAVNTPKQLVDTVRR